jgi:hypothetical protein
VPCSTAPARHLLVVAPAPEQQRLRVLLRSVQAAHRSNDHPSEAAGRGHPRSSR